MTVAEPTTGSTTGPTTGPTSGLTRFARTPVAPTFDDLDGEHLAIDAKRSLCYSLNSSAGAVWQLLAEPRTLGEVVELLTAEFEVEPARCASEVTQLLCELRSAGLVEAVDA